MHSAREINISVKHELICQGFQWNISHPFVLRFMIKRAQGRNRFGMKNFKKRWFRLTNHEFTYHKTKGEVKGFSGSSYGCIVSSSVLGHHVCLCKNPQEGENLQNVHLAWTHVQHIWWRLSYWAGNTFFATSKQAQAKTYTWAVSKFHTTYWTKSNTLKLVSMQTKIHFNFIAQRKERSCSLLLKLKVNCIKDWKHFREMFN